MPFSREKYEIIRLFVVVFWSCCPRKKKLAPCHWPMAIVSIDCSDLVCNTQAGGRIKHWRCFLLLWYTVQNYSKLNQLFCLFECISQKSVCPSSAQVSTPPLNCGNHDVPLQTNRTESLELIEKQQQKTKKRNKKDKEDHSLCRGHLPLF